METCPECGTAAVRRCLCRGGESICVHWHVWTWCEVHHKSRLLKRGEDHADHWPSARLCNCIQDSDTGLAAVSRFLTVLTRLDDARRKRVLALAETLLEEMPQYDNINVLKDKTLIIPSSEQ